MSRLLVCSWALPELLRRQALQPLPLPVAAAVRRALADPCSEHTRESVMLLSCADRLGIDRAGTLRTMSQRGH